MSDDTDTTRVNTLWSETQLDLLYVALQKNLPDRRILEVVNDLLDRGMHAPYIVEKAQEKCGAIGATRVRRLIRAQ